MLIGLLGTTFSEILIGIEIFSFKKIHLKMSAKWRQFCLGHNVLISLMITAIWQTWHRFTATIYVNFMDRVNKRLLLSSIINCCNSLNLYVRWYDKRIHDMVPLDLKRISCLCNTHVKVNDLWTDPNTSTKPEATNIPGSMRTDQAYVGVTALVTYRF